MKKVHKYKKVTSNNKIRERIFDNPPCKFGSQFTPLQTGSNIRHCSDGSLGNDLFLMQKSSMLYYQLWASRTSSGRTFTGAHNRHSSTFPSEGCHLRFFLGYHLPRFFSGCSPDFFLIYKYET